MMYEHVKMPQKMPKNPGNYRVFSAIPCWGNARGNRSEGRRESLGNRLTHAVWGSGSGLVPSRGRPLQRAPERSAPINVSTSCPV